MIRTIVVAAFLTLSYAYTHIWCRTCSDAVSKNLDGYPNYLIAFKNCCEQCDTDNPADFTTTTIAPPAVNEYYVENGTAAVWYDPTYIVDEPHKNPDYMQLYIDANQCPPKRRVVITSVAIESAVPVVSLSTATTTPKLSLRERILARRGN